MRFWIKFNPTQRLATIDNHRQIIEGYMCPKCGNKNLKVLSLEEGSMGWEAKVQCERCVSHMTLNNTGFQINFTDGNKK